MFLALYENAHQDIEKAQKGVVVLDEIDRTLDHTLFVVLEHFGKLWHGEAKLQQTPCNQFWHAFLDTNRVIDFTGRNCFNLFLSSKLTRIGVFSFKK